MNQVRPTKCCEMGTFECQVPMPIRRRIEYIDFCIADVVAALNAAGIETLASCCGHGKIPASIVIEDGREISIPVEQVVRPWERKGPSP